MAKKILLVDGNSIGYAAQQATKLSYGGVETQAAFGILKTANDLRNQYKDFTIIFLWDDRAQWRYDLYPGYKAKRDETPEKVAMKESYAAQKPYIERILSSLGVRQMTATGYEADDLAGWLTVSLSADPSNTVGLISGDQDWMQLVRPNVFWRDMRDDAKYIDHKNFYERTGCKSPFAFLECKILHGDTSDTITGVGGIGEKGAPEFIAEFGSVREFWRRCDTGEFEPKLKAHKNLWKGTSEMTLEEHMALFPANDGSMDEKTYEKAAKKHRDAWIGQGRLIYKRNFQLMQLLRVKPPAKTAVRSNNGKFDKEEFMKVCGELGFMSVLRNIDAFTSKFEGK